MSEECTTEPAGAIRAIDKHSVHQICSGQVVLTLATAVKELVENSVDAGATNIEVRLKDSGAELVEVSDNGKGVEEANFEGLTLKHHTSKIRDFSDLIHVETFGFRGEALSSLCALSDLMVVTCHESSQVGTKLVFDHKGNLVQKSPQPRQQGTTVSLQQLFYTLPVRHKEFQRNIKKEYAKMIHVLQSYCIISTGVRITCSNQTGQAKRSTVLSTSGSQSMRDNIGAIFGPKQLQTLLPFQQVFPAENVMDEYGLKDTDLPKHLFVITGFVSRADHGVGRSSTDRQFFFINNRPCDPLKVAKIVNEVYHMYNRHQYPFVALSITVASECVDVNVTPDKRQIFLQEEKLLLAIIKTSLINTYEAGVNKISLNFTHKPATSVLSSPEPQVVPSDGNLPESGEESDLVIQSPKSSLNLASLKAAFSSHHSSAKSACVSGNINSGPTQKTLQSFLKSGAKSAVANTNIVSNLKTKKDYDKCSVVGRGVLDSFRFGKEQDSRTENSVPSCDPSISHNETVSQVLTENMTIKVEACEQEAEEENNTFVESKACVLKESCRQSPNPKRAKRDSPVVLTKSNAAFSNESKSSSPSTVDAPISLQRKTVPVQFSFQQLELRIKKLQQRGGAKDEPKYRRFRAKINPGDNQSAEDELKKEICKDMFKEMEIIGQFNLGFIITKLNSDIFMIDQHATDEKYNFEMLQQHTVLQGQRLIVPQNLHLTAVSENILIENIDIFRKNGFEFLINEDAQVMERVKLVSLPTSKNWTFGPADIEELIFMLSDSPGVMCRPSRVRQMFASRACRKSVMIGTALSVSEMKKLVVHMGEIEQPWNCPHGRPTMRHLANLDIISQD
ncbi:mismatch repair endonuclease PMS2 [Periophthalmus magnuspinnatus]|nr:mismatch repair endonuclease PMS2 [Periophthalmus magnuspinnatus]